jgi:dTDP-4-dehydrorhamnose reductase
MSEKNLEIFIVGGDSMLGSALAAAASARGFPFKCSSRRPGADWSIDLASDPFEWKIPRTSSHAVICAATTGLQECENDPRGTAAINVKATISLAGLLAERGMQIVFLSSSRVFPPHFEYPSEATPPEPVTEYGRQKLAVEKHLLSHLPSAKIIRLAKVVSPSLPLLGIWSRSLDRRETVNAFSDLFLSPVSLPEAANAILKIAVSFPSPGIFHISATDAISYRDLARSLAVRLNANPDLVVGTSSPAPNTPGSSILSCRQTSKSTGLQFHTATENLDTALQEIF